MSQSPARLTWWRGTLVVAERNLIENLRSRTVKLVTAFLLLASVALIVVPQLFGDDRTSYTLATVGEPSPALRQALDAAAEVADFDVDYTSLDDEAGLREAVRDGTATAGLTANRIYTSAETEGTFPVVVTQTVVGLETMSRMAEAELTPAQVEQLQSVQPPEQVVVQSEQERARSGVAFASGIVLYLALTFAGSAIATAVAVEKSTRISEVLLAVLRPSQVLVGTVAAVGAIALAQLLVLIAPLAVAVRVTDDIGLPPVTTGDLSLAVLWFLVGFALYAFVFAASAALVDKITEVSSAISPVTMILIAAYLVAIMVVTPDPRSGWSTAASMFPLTAPMAMPIRWATGDVPVYQLVLSLLLTAVAAVCLVWVAAVVYRRALVVTGHRLGLRELPALIRSRARD